MFTDFVQEGSLTGVGMMVICLPIMMASTRLVHPTAVLAPRIMQGPIASLFLFCAIPLPIWPAIYIGLFEGFITGLISWGLIQASAVVLHFLLRLPGPWIGLYFAAACIIYPIGYVLTLTSLPA